MSGNRRPLGIAMIVMALLGGCTSATGATRSSGSSAPTLVAPPSASATATAAATSTRAAPSVSSSQVAAVAAATEIVFASGRDKSGTDQVYIMAADGSNQTLLTKDFGGGWMPSFSPDRTKVAFSSDHGDGMNIYTMNVDGSNVTQITKNDFNSFHAMWSPDGTQILYQGFPDGLYVVGPDGSGQRQLSTGVMAAWSADGQHARTNRHRSPDGSRRTRRL